MLKRPGRRVQPVKAGQSGQPKESGLVLADVRDRPEKTVRTVTVDRESRGSFRNGIEPIELFVGADPEIP